MGAPALTFLPVFFATSLLLFSTLSSSAAAITNNDTEALFRFRTETDAHGNLLSNWTSSDACTSSWQGVRCSAAGRVISLSLPFLDLRGPIDSLSSLDQLRFLDLHGNRLNGSIIPITNCSNLKLLYFSNNDFSGEIPSHIASLKRLLRVDLSNNNLRGPIPASISNLTRLLTLRLQNNLFSGQLPDLSSSLPLLKELNVSNNQLFGRLPIGLQRKFGLKSFAGNAGLCGSSPLPVCSFTSASPPASSTGSSDPTVVPSNPSSMPTTTSSDPTRKEKPRKGLKTGAVVGIVVATSVVLLVIVSFVVAHCCKRCPGENTSSSKAGSDYSRSKKSFTGEKKVYANNGGGGAGDSDGTTATDRSKLVFFDRRKQFELEDLLRASAEMLGKGSLGTVYKAVLEDGCTAAVKRLKDANPCARKEFEQYMDLIGKLKHPNIVRLRAYYYAKEEKLLVYDYLSNGSLHYLLHGNRGPGRIPLDWTTRISLVLGAARGLARIHEEYSVSKIPHGNVKSSNVLLDKNGVACISDFGLSLLLNPVHATARLGGYRAPEQAETKRLSQKADVYSFGVLLLEVLTGRAPTQYPSPTRPRGEEEDQQGLDLPTWVRSVVRDEWTAEVFDPELLRYKNIEEEMVSMLQVAMACVVQQPEKRPTMTEVAKMIEDIGVEQSPLGEDLDESRNSLSPSLATTDDAMAGF
ncbi:leucine-rich repeat receptor-like protein kinase PXC1 [Macadamia integrifolia]|uniref:leucine-rich repeat receptor-like protein kinase PXC1 n=1 Tax=Macadamia integrifolia TaxID=60698 RepID=UPI001C4F5B1E|nr:leucine-rich repeat receptor-like protein kinase PXC1 [Macadamia integrifolia]